jgi:hypothetical protein
VVDGKSLLFVTLKPIMGQRTEYNESTPLKNLGENQYDETLCNRLLKGHETESRYA